jgi:hypothetical protein
MLAQTRLEKGAGKLNIGATLRRIGRPGQIEIAFGERCHQVRKVLQARVLNGLARAKLAGRVLTEHIELLHCGGHALFSKLVALYAFSRGQNQE